MNTFGPRVGAPQGEQTAVAVMQSKPVVEPTREPAAGEETETTAQVVPATVCRFLVEVIRGASGNVQGIAVPPRDVIPADEHFTLGYPRASLSLQEVNNPAMADFFRGGREFVVTLQPAEDFKKAGEPVGETSGLGAESGY